MYFRKTLMQKFIFGFFFCTLIVVCPVSKTPPGMREIHLLLLVPCPLFRKCVLNVSPLWHHKWHCYLSQISKIIQKCAWHLSRSSVCVCVLIMEEVRLVRILRPLKSAAGVEATHVFAGWSQMFLRRAFSSRRLRRRWWSSRVFAAAKHRAGSS